MIKVKFIYDDLFVIADDRRSISVELPDGRIFIDGINNIWVDNIWIENISKLGERFFSLEINGEKLPSSPGFEIPITIFLLSCVLEAHHEFGAKYLEQIKGDLVHSRGVFTPEIIKKLDSLIKAILPEYDILNEFITHYPQWNPVDWQLDIFEKIIAMNPPLELFQTQEYVHDIDSGPLYFKNSCTLLSHPIASKLNYFNELFNIKFFDECISSNPNAVQFPEFRSFFKNKKSHILCNLAENLSAPNLEEYEELFRSPDYFVRECAAKNPNAAKLAGFKLLLNDKDEKIRELAKENLNKNHPEIKYEVNNSRE